MMKDPMTPGFELVIRILCDSRPPTPVDGAYLFCTTVDNQWSVFMTARTIINVCMARQIIILQAKPMAGYPGVFHFRKGLEGVGVPAASICDVPASDSSSINTLIESQALIRYAKNQEIGSLIVVSPPLTNEF